MLIIPTIVSIILIWFDQFTKSIIDSLYKDSESIISLIDKSFIFDLIGIAYVENRGAAFGILQGGRLFFIIITPIVLITIIYYYIKLPKAKIYNIIRIALILIFSGAIGNFIDRFKNGYVIDFIYFKFIDFPVFNFADIYVVLGTALISIIAIFFMKGDGELK